MRSFPKFPSFVLSPVKLPSRALIRFSGFLCGRPQALPAFPWSFRMASRPRTQRVRGWIWEPPPTEGSSKGPSCGLWPLSASQTRNLRIIVSRSLFFTPDRVHSPVPARLPGNRHLLFLLLVRWPFNLLLGPQTGPCSARREQNHPD